MILRPMNLAARRGLTLMEVIVSLAIFVGALAVISKLVGIGIRSSRYAQLQTRAVVLAESKMGELVAGVTSLSSGGGNCDEDAAWRWDLSVSDGPYENLKWVSVTISPSSTGELANRREQVEYTLSRWLLDPSAMTSSSSSTSSTSTSP